MKKTAALASIPPNKRTPRKADFVRAQSLKLSAAEVVALAAKQGIEITDKYVYNVRSKAKKDWAKGKAKKVAAPVKKMGRPKGSKNKAKAKAKPEKAPARVFYTDHRAQFLTLVLDMGFKNALEIIADARDRILKP